LRTIPQPNKHLVHFYGVYANRVRSTYRNDERAVAGAELATPSRRTLSKRWAELIYRIYEVDPLTCKAANERSHAGITESEFEQSSWGLLIPDASPFMIRLPLVMTSRCF
jgi:hypothetical protein